MRGTCWNGRQQLGPVRGERKVGTTHTNRFMKEKNCSKCKESKPLTDFSKDNSRASGLYPSCKLCQRMYSQSIKKIVMNHYGDSCVCCGERNLGFLTLDHIGSDGFLEKHKGYNMYRKILREGFPENLQVLCWNCNSGRHYNGGICPHKSVREINMGNAHPS